MDTQKIVLGSGSEICPTPIRYLGSGSAICPTPLHYLGSGSAICPTPLHYRGSGSAICPTPLHYRGSGSEICPTPLLNGNQMIYVNVVNASATQVVMIPTLIALPPMKIRHQVSCMAICL
jgi:hypothetical protein